MFNILGDILCNTIKIADAVVGVPLKIANEVVIKPVASVAEEIKNLID